MKICHQGNTLCISEVPELDFVHAENFTAELRPALAPGVENVIVDLSATTIMDCSGLGALIAWRNKARLRPIRLNFVNPTPLVRRLLSLTRLDCLLEPVPVSLS
ncbi:MAG: hypothetical protein JWQ04_2710 [Pedosphaera sp.]|nr:hypothetical protein [Pedosphaera sp.]